MIVKSLFFPYKWQWLHLVKVECYAVIFFFTSQVNCCFNDSFLFWLIISSFVFYCNVKSEQVLNLSVEDICTLICGNKHVVLLVYKVLLGGSIDKAIASLNISITFSHLGPGLRIIVLPLLSLLLS